MNASVLDEDRKHILERTVNLWDGLRNQRVFITGGTGFVGTWLMEAFVAANRAFDLKASAVLLSRDPARFQAKSPHLLDDGSVSLIAGDATTFEAPPGELAFVIHAATERAFDATREQPLSTLTNDLRATQRVLDLASKHGTRRMLLTSSGAVYGSGATSLERIPESYEGAPDVTQSRSVYGEGKRASEFACASYGRTFGFQAVIARLFAFVGPFFPLDEGYAVGSFLADVLAERAIAIGGDGTARRSYLYGADLAIWLWTMLLRGEGGRAYNVGSPHAISIRELAGAVADTLAPGTPVTVAQDVTPGAPVSSYVPDTTRAETELGLRAWVPLSDALQRTFDFYSPPQRTTP